MRCTYEMRVRETRARKKHPNEKHPYKIHTVEGIEIYQRAGCTIGKAWH
jgi:hypothetical protein